MICDPLTAAKRNVHGVPEEKVLEMFRNMEPLPPHYNVVYENSL